MIYVIGIPALAVAVSVLVVARRVDLTGAQKLVIGLMAAVVGVGSSTLMFYGLAFWETARHDEERLLDSETRILAVGLFNTVIVSLTGYLLSWVRWMRGRFGFGERIFSIRTPEELVAETRGKTNVQVRVITKRHLGTWLRVEGPVDQIYQVLMSYYVRTRDVTGVNFEMELGALRWGRKLRAMDIGDKIVVEGVIKEIHSYGISLTACEVVPNE